MICDDLSYLIARSPHSNHHLQNQHRHLLHNLLHHLQGKLPPYQNTKHLTFEEVAKWIAAWRTIMTLQQPRLSLTAIKVIQTTRLKERSTNNSRHHPLLSNTISMVLTLRQTIRKHSIMVQQVLRTMQPRLTHVTPKSQHHIEPAQYLVPPPTRYDLTKSSD